MTRTDAITPAAVPASVPAAVPASVPADGRPRRGGWHPLRVSRTEPVGDQATAITLDVPDRLADTFAYRPGQHVLVRSQHTGRELRRSYSVCLPPGERHGLRLVVKYLGPGGFAEYATTALAVGDLLELSPPTGHFTLVEEPGAHHVLIGGGSGVTPLLSIAAAALRADPSCRVSLICANRSARSVLLADELSDLKDAHVGRFSVLHVLSQEARESDLLSGRIDGTRLPALLALLGVEPGDRAQYYLCGPLGLVELARVSLERWGADPTRVRFELFSTSTSTSASAPASAPPATSARRAGAVTVSARLDGRTTTVELRPEDRVLLDALLRARPETPYSCRDGLCGSCRARVLLGTVTMDRQYALDAAELAAGYTLACRAGPASDRIDLDFDA